MSQYIRTKKEIADMQKQLKEIKNANIPFYNLPKRTKLILKLMGKILRLGINEDDYYLLEGKKSIGFTITYNDLTCAGLTYDWLSGKINDGVLIVAFGYEGLIRVDIKKVEV